MPLTYPDQNAIIQLGRKARAAEFRKNLDAALMSGNLTFVVSAWHLVETANTANAESAIELAEFIDSLNPSWILERHDIRKIEVTRDFCSFASVQYQPPPCVTTRSAAFAALNRQPDGPRFNIPSADFVKQWLAHPEQLKPLEKPYQDNAEALIRLRELRKAGEIADDFRERIDQELIKPYVPSRSPAGLEVGRELIRDYIAQANVNSIPTIAIETAISEHEWDAQGGADRNTLIDKFHIISALPYVDEVVSSDRFFHRIFPVVQCTGHVRARLLANDDLLSRFL